MSGMGLLADVCCGTRDVCTAVCTENLNPDVVVMKPAEDDA